MRPRAKQLRMTRMHFEAIAETLASLRPTVVAEGQTTGAAAYAQWAETVQKFADLCASSNNLFRADKFLRACGGAATLDEILRVGGPDALS